MSRICSRLFLGGIKDAERLATANPEGITAVISLCAAAEVLPKGREIEYVHIPVDDSRPVPLQRFEAIMAAIAKHIRNGKVLLHCAGGTSRSPIFAAAWMHRVGYLHIESALLDIAELRPVIDPSPVLLKSVKEHLCR
ncbi:MAG: dual specificity protein phosphatase [Terriglobales bacterium]